MALPLNTTLQPIMGGANLQGDNYYGSTIAGYYDPQSGQIYTPEQMALVSQAAMGADLQSRGIKAPPGMGGDWLSGTLAGLNGGASGAGGAGAPTPESEMGRLAGRIEGVAGGQQAVGGEMLGLGQSEYWRDRTLADQLATGGNQQFGAGQAIQGAGTDAAQKGQQQWQQALQYANDWRPFADAAMRQQMDAATRNNQLAQQAGQTYSQYFNPLNAQIAQEAATWDSPARQEQEAARAAGDVTQSFAQQRQQLGRDLASYGLDPSSGRYAALANQMAANQAAGTAGAMTNARYGVQQQGFDKRLQAAGLGQNILGAQSQLTGTATQAAQGAGNTGAQYLETTSNALARPTAWYSTAGSLYNTAGNLYRGATSAWDASTRATQPALNWYQGSNQAYDSATRGYGVAGGLQNDILQGTLTREKMASEEKIAKDQAQARQDAADSEGFGSFLGGVGGLLTGASKLGLKL